MSGSTSCCSPAPHVVLYGEGMTAAFSLEAKAQASLNSIAIATGSAPSSPHAAVAAQLQGAIPVPLERFLEVGLARSEAAKLRRRYVVKRAIQMRHRLVLVTVIEGQLPRRRQLEVD